MENLLSQGGKGNTVIDYVMGSEEVRKGIREMRVGIEWSQIITRWR